MMQAYSYEAMVGCAKPSQEVTVRNDLEIPQVVCWLRDLENYDCSIEHECIDGKDVFTAWMLQGQISHLYCNSRTVRWIGDPEPKDPESDYWNN